MDYHHAIREDIDCFRGISFQEMMIFQNMKTEPVTHILARFSVFCFLANIIEELLIKLHGHYPRNGTGEGRNVTSV